MLNCIPVILYTFYRPPGSWPEIHHDLNSSFRAMLSHVALFWQEMLIYSLSTGPPIYQSLWVLGFMRWIDLFFVCNCPEIITNVLTSTPERCGFPADHHISEFTVLLKFKLSKSVRATPTISNAGIFKIFAVSCHIPLWKLHFLEALTRAELCERICFCQL